MIVVMDGRRYETGRVRIEDLAEWHQAHPGMVPAGTMTIDGEAEWPPAVVYEVDDGRRTMDEGGPQDATGD